MNKAIILKKLVSGVIALVLVLSLAHAAYVLYPFDESKRPECNVKWTGPIEWSFFTKVQVDLDVALTAKCETLNVALLSPGGSVIWSVETSQEIKRARKKGLIVAIHGRSLVASGATLVLAAGSPGHRFIAHNTLALLHGVQRSGGFMEPPTCVDFRTLPAKADEEAIVLRRILVLIISELSDSVNKPFPVVEQWFRCGKEQAGPGSLLVTLGIADKEE